MESYLKKLGLWDILKTQKKIPVPTTILQIMHGEKTLRSTIKEIIFNVTNKLFGEKKCYKQATSHGGKSTISECNVEISKDEILTYQRTKMGN